MGISGLLLVACTAFSMPAASGGHYVGKSYDWNEGAGLLVVNHRDLARRALGLGATGAPMEWVSRHASLTFNQYGVGFPNGGMNEKGLIVEILWLEASTYPAPDARPALNELEWIQYQLDTQETVAGMREAAGRVRVQRAYARVHYFACDAAGACGAFEYLDGKLVISEGEAMPAKVLTNNPYAQGAAQLASSRRTPKGRGSLERFVRAARRAQGPAASVQEVFALLDSVSLGTYSKWNIAYDPATLTVHFRTRSAPRIKHLSLPALAGGCDAPVQVLDLDTAEAGDAAGRLRPLDPASHRSFLERTLGPLGPRLPPGALDAVAAHAASPRCAP